MSETTQFELVSPEKLLLAQAAEMVVVPGSEGDFGALPRHTPMITGVRPGVIDVYENGKIAKRMFVAGGFAEVNETRITVLAEEAIPLNELNADIVQARLRAAKTELSDATSDHGKREAARKVAVAEAMEAALG